MGTSKEKLTFNVGDTDNSDSVGSFIIGADGTAVTGTAIGSKKTLDVNVVDNGISNVSYLATNKTISTSQTQAKVSTNNLSGRKTLIIYNTGANEVYFGPSGVTISTGIKIFPNQMMSLNAGESINIFLITASSTSTVVIQEMS